MQKYANCTTKVKFPNTFVQLCGTTNFAKQLCMSGLGINVNINLVKILLCANKIVVDVVKTC